MKKLLLWVLFFLLPFFYSIYVCAQPKKERDCSTTCFSSEVVSVRNVSETCSSYELKVSYSGACAHALSHFAVAVPCGKIENVWNSENWAQEIGTDPTSGLSGLKIDNISGFGEGSLKYFTVKFNICTTDESCAAQMSCWQPQVAYKASTCVNYETLDFSCKSLKASLTKTDVSCFGQKDGSIEVVIEEGNEPYSYRWSDNSTAQSISAIEAGVYSVVVTDGSGAEITLEETIFQPGAIAITGTTVPASCNGAADGSIDVTVSGGSGAYSFLWNNAAETEDLQTVTSGQYLLTVKDGNDCSVSARFTVGNTSEINITGTHVKPDCNSSNGSIDIAASGGSLPYTYSWTSGATTEDLQGISAGVYTVTVTDNAGCFAKSSYFIKDDNTLMLEGTTTPTGCTGDASGSVELSVSGGTAPYTYSWSNGETTEDLSSLGTGYYTVTVTDSKNCTATAGFVVSKTSFQVPVVVVQPSCHDDANGSITLQEPIGGSAPFSYLWSNGETGTSITDLEAGTYSVTVTDAAGCTRTLTYTINNPTGIFASADVSNAQCDADGFFAVDLTVSGGTPSYSFEWSDGETAEDRAGLEQGLYTVTITDAHGCSVQKEINVQGSIRDFSCAINEPGEMPSCGSVNNALSTSMADADSYSWTVESTDGGWSLSGGDSPAILYTAGGENSSATFTLSVTMDGCTRTCSYTLTACKPADNGGGTDPGEDPGGEDPGNGGGGDETCEACFSTTAKLIEASGDCRTYEMEVSTNGLCRHDLSHWTLAIPCGSVSNYSNSEGWKMEFGKDPTTGLYGLKVDDINHFGKEVESFTVRFTLCGSVSCEVGSWDPRIAYKAGLCVGIETIGIESSAQGGNTLSVYPNPFTEVINFEWSADEADVQLEIIDQYGNTMSRFTNSAGQNAAARSISLESGALPKGMYYYRMIVGDRIFNGKISKR